MTVLIEEASVTAVNLSLYLEEAVIQHELQEDEGIYVTEDRFFPCWIRVLKKSGFIGFSTYAVFRNSSARIERLEFANQINSKNFMTTAYVDSEKLIMDHVLNYRDGMLKETFIRGCRQYSGSIEKSISEPDPDYKVLRRLNETEPEDVENE